MSPSRAPPVIRATACTRSSSKFLKATDTNALVQRPLLPRILQVPALAAAVTRRTALRRGAFGFTYDVLSRRATLTRPNAVNTAYAYDPVSNLMSILHQKGGVTLDGATYSHTYSGVTDNINWEQKTDNRNGDIYGYRYDNL